MDKKENKKFKSFALMQVVVLVVALFAFSWMVGNSFGEVSAAGEGDAQCVALGGSCSEPLTSQSGDECTINGQSGTVKSGLCTGDFTSKRCCVPAPQQDGSSSDSCNYCKGNDLYFGVTTSGGGCGLGIKVQTCENGCINGACVESNVNFKGLVSSAAGAYGTYQTAKTILNTGAKKGATLLTKKGTESAVSESIQTLSGSGLESLFGKEALTFKTFILGQGGPGAQIIAGGIWTGVAFVLGRYVIGPLIGLDTQNSQALGYALGGGALAGYTLLIATESVLVATGVGILVAAVIFIATAKHSSTDVVTYSCYSWDAQLGGEKCEECNNQDIPCTEYQCKTLGQACEFSKDSETGQTLCRWENPNDIKPPQISAWDDALFSNDYEYTPNNAISPPNKGVKIEYNGIDSESGCAPAWTPVSFGITLNERAKCKYSLGTIYDRFDDMPANYFSKGLSLYNHSFALSLPTTASLAAENITVENGGVYEFYTMCQDSNGNANSGFFGIKFCINDGPDNNVPIIEEIYPPTDSPFGVDQSNQSVTLYINEPSECKWDRLNKSYSDMENNFSCVTSASAPNERGFYECKTILEGLKDNVKNKFYFRCKDQPWLEGTEESGIRNENRQSTEYSLIGTSELVINSVSPNDEMILDSVSPVQVEINVRTDFGYDDGKSICSIRDNNAGSNFIEFFYGYNSERYSQYEHSQVITLEEGEYNYTIKCWDIANNQDQETITFNVSIDDKSPEVIRLFKIDNELQIITNENAKCVYSTDSCVYGFNDGIEMNSYLGEYGTELFSNWNANKNLYVKCEDEFGNRPTSDKCTIIIRPVDIPELK